MKKRDQVKPIDTLNNLNVLNNSTHNFLVSLSKFPGLIMNKKK